MMFYFNLALGAVILMSVGVALWQTVRPGKAAPDTNLSGRPIVVPPLPPIRKEPDSLG